MVNRKKFLQQSSLLLGGSVLASSLPHKAFAYTNSGVAPSDQINIGAIGVNGMGWSDVTAAVKVPGVNLVAICDIDKTVLDKRMNDMSKIGVDPAKVKTYSDYKEVLDRKDIDAVIIGTPDHWHALIMMQACEAGKDVYCEKPVGNSIGECRAMVKAQQRYNKVVQAGQWQRSQQHFRDAVDFVQGGPVGQYPHRKSMVLPGMDETRSGSGRQRPASRCGLCEMAGAGTGASVQQQPVSF